jgi:hypothetical protein
MSHLERNVYANLAGGLEAMAKNIVKAVVKKRVKKPIFISSIDIYDVPLKPVPKVVSSGL